MKSSPSRQAALRLGHRPGLAHAARGGGRGLRTRPHPEDAHRQDSNKRVLSLGPGVQVVLATQSISAAVTAASSRSCGRCLALYLDLLRRRVTSTFQLSDQGSGSRLFRELLIFHVGARGLAVAPDARVVARPAQLTPRDRASRADPGSCSCDMSLLSRDELVPHVIADGRRAAHNSDCPTPRADQKPFR